MSFDLKGWIDDLARKGSLSEADKNLLHEKLKPAEQEMRDAFLRQSDYSRRIAEVQEMKKKEEEYVAQIAAWEASQKERYGSLEAKAALADEYEAQLKTLQAQYGGVIPDIKIKEMAQAQVVEKMPDLKEYVKAEDANRSVMEMFKAQTLLLKLDNRHQQMFGTRLEDPDELVDYALTSGKSLETAWRDKYNVSAREAELQEAAIQKRIEEGIAKEREAWLSNQALPGITPNAGGGSPIFAVIKPESATSQGHKRAERVAAAVSDYRQNAG